MRRMDERQAESGMASFLIVMIMIVVISLIVLGFSQITRHNQREALDRQLSSQAFYAAESGVNVAAGSIASYVKSNGFANLPTKTSCANNYDPAAVNGSGAPISDLSSGVRYTCVLVDPSPTTLKYDPTQKSSTIIPLQANGNLRSLTFTWSTQSGSANTTCAGSNAQVFPQASAWPCDYGILRVDLVANPTGNVSNLSDNTVTMFLTPLGGHSGTLSLPAFPSATQAHAYIASASGCGSGACTATISFPPDSDTYYARVTSLYRDAPNMIVSGTLSNSSPATFSGAQAIVDTTGQAQDELRRIQVRVQLNATADTIPNGAVASGGDVCKRFSIMSGNNVDPLNLCQ